MISTNELDDQTIELTKALIRGESVSPIDAGCQTLLIEKLTALGFSIEQLPFGDVQNFLAICGTQGPLFVFAGHTDVVPPGPLEQWDSNPFEPTVEGDMLYGRGAADMKGSLAAMITATERFLAAVKAPTGRIGFLITSDEEADAVNGTVKVIEAMTNAGTYIDWCLVGEPSSSEKLGDVIRVGRRGSLNARLTIKGVQGHVAYPDDADNPIHKAMPALAELASMTWDEGNAYFPATTMQISNIHGGTGANNVIPSELNLLFNFRFSTESDEASLRTRTENLLNCYDLNYHIQWSLSGNPFLTTGGELIPATQKAIRQRCGIETELSTSGGTSDGRFIAPTGTQVVELGPRNSTIHKINECTSINELKQLSLVYTDILIELLG